MNRSAGIAAALVAKQQVSGSAVPYPKLRERLLAQQQVFIIPPVLLVKHSNPNSR